MFETALYWIPDSLEILREMADAQDYQVWIERVDSSGQIGIIEDGRLVSGPLAEKEKSMVTSGDCPKGEESSNG